MTLTGMWPTYMVQLLVDLCGSASNARWVSLFQRLRDPAIQVDLVTLDSCCINGVQEYCSLWSEILETLTKQDKLDIKAVLGRPEVKPLTAQAVMLAGKPTTVDASQEEVDKPSHNVLSVSELADFGKCATTPAADAMLELRWLIAVRLISIARTVHVPCSLKRTVLATNVVAVIQ